MLACLLSFQRESVNSIIENTEPAWWLRPLELRAPDAEGCRFDSRMGRWALDHEVAGWIPARDAGLRPLQLTAATGPGGELRLPRLRSEGQQLDWEKAPAIHPVPQ